MFSIVKAEDTPGPSNGRRSSGPLKLISSEKSSRRLRSRVVETESGEDFDETSMIESSKVLHDANGKSPESEKFLHSKLRILVFCLKSWNISPSKLTQETVLKTRLENETRKLEQV